MSDIAASAELMDRLYRRQRHLYDFTRKYYLLGRDRMIQRLSPPAGSRVLEIGCGTARNLVVAAHAYPDVHFFGIDISTEMLDTARGVIERWEHGDLAEAVRELAAAVAKAEGGAL